MTILSQEPFIPRMFALRRDGSIVVAWGMTLPDGSVFTVNWPKGRSSTVTVCGSAGRAARLRNAEVVWVDSMSGANRTYLQGHRDTLRDGCPRIPAVGNADT